MNVETVNDLGFLLKSKFNDNLIIVDIDKEDGSIEGFYNNIEFLLSYNKDKNLILSVINDDKIIFDRFLPLLKLVMNNINPLCTYEVYTLEFDDVMYNMEWELVNPHERIKTIKKAEDLPENTKLRNFKLYNFEVVNNDIIDFNERKNTR